MSNDRSGNALAAGEPRTPSLVLLGAPRCGTTAIGKWLDDSGFSVGVKDSFYLMDEESGLKRENHLDRSGVAGYQDLFPASELPSAECSAGYLYQRTALRFFATWERPPAFAVVVRDPVARLRSVHRYFTGNLGLLPRTMSFEAYVDQLRTGSIIVADQTVSDALQQGRYADAIEPWARQFGRERIHVVSFDDLVDDPASVISSLFTAAGSLPQINLDEYRFESFNSSYTPRSAVIARATAIGRRFAPRGRARAWAGERVRRLQRGGSDTRPLPDAEVDTKVVESLREYYRDSNIALRDAFGVDISKWV